jgi:ribosome-associated translation inhibitor RaiA
MYNAIDKVIHKVEEKIHREKGKMQEHNSNREGYVESLAENEEA